MQPPYRLGRESGIGVAVLQNDRRGRRCGPVPRGLATGEWIGTATTGGIPGGSWGNLAERVRERGISRAGPGKPPPNTTSSSYKTVGVRLPTTRPPFAADLFFDETHFAAVWFRPTGP